MEPQLERKQKQKKFAAPSSTWRHNGLPLEQSLVELPQSANFHCYIRLCRSKEARRSASLRRTDHSVNWLSQFKVVCDVLKC